MDKRLDSSTTSAPTCATARAQAGSRATRASSADHPLLTPALSSVLEEALALGSWCVHIELDHTQARVRLRHVGGLSTRRFDRSQFDAQLLCPTVPTGAIDDPVTRWDWCSDTGKQVRLDIVPLTTHDGPCWQIGLSESRSQPALLDELIDDRPLLSRLRSALKRRHGLIALGTPARELSRSLACALAADAVSPDRRVLHLSDRHDQTQPGVLQVSLDDLSFERIPATCRSLLALDLDVVVIDAHLPPALRGVFDALAGHRLVVRTLELPEPSRILASLRGDGADGDWLAEHLQQVVFLDQLRSPCEVCCRVESGDTLVMAPCDADGFARALLTASLSRRVEANGCPACHDSGFGTIRPVHDLAEIDHRLRQLLRSNDTQAADIALLDTRRLPALACALAHEGRLSHSEATRLGR